MTESVEIPQRQAAARSIVKQHVPWAIGAGALPLPGVDLAALVAVQLSMLAKLAKHYGLAFRKTAVKSVVVSLLGDVLGTTLSGGLMSLTKAIPGVGTLVGVVATPALAGGVTYAVGKVFISHFEAGGTLLDLDPEALRRHFHEELRRGNDNAVPYDADAKVIKGDKV